MRPDYAHAHNNLGNIYRYLRDFVACEESYKRAIKCDPSFELPMINLGALYLNSGRRQQASEIYSALEKSQGKSFDKLFFMASYLLDGNLYSQALGHLDKAALMQPNSAVTFHRIGICHLKLKNFSMPILIRLFHLVEFVISFLVKISRQED